MLYVFFDNLCVWEQAAAPREQGAELCPQPPMGERGVLPPLARRRMHRPWAHVEVLAVKRSCRCGQTHAQHRSCLLSQKCLMRVLVSGAQVLKLYWLICGGSSWLVVQGLHSWSHADSLHADISWLPARVACSACHSTAWPKRCHCCWSCCCWSCCCILASAAAGRHAAAAARVAACMCRFCLACTARGVTHAGWHRSCCW
ncbi:hypothetical protein COO60DRAFT_1528500 [Scenedesmus sp. NREL 46B-D3]|nr:hypothetical protein COO60DRAFT_1528500 [Scenedesmus sp. NREL 46B-D3]